MQTSRRALIAAQPAAYSVLQRIVGEDMAMVPAHSMGEAFRVLEQNRGAIDLIVCTIAFDESRMIEFLQAVKRDAATRGIPFLGARVFPGVLSHHLLDSMRAACKEAGACDLIDIAKLGHDKAKAALETGITRCLAS